VKKEILLAMLNELKGKTSKIEEFEQSGSI